MSYIKDLFNSFSSLLSTAAAADANPLAPGSDRAMESSAAAAGPSDVVGERAALKLKGYFELAKEEIDKAVRAEEWGLADDAVVHYRNALRIMLESKAVRVPGALSSVEKIQVKSYQQKISKWQGQVAERLKVLSQRTGMEMKKRKKMIGFGDLGDERSGQRRGRRLLWRRCERWTRRLRRRREGQRLGGYARGGQGGFGGDTRGSGSVETRTVDKAASATTRRRGGSGSVTFESADYSRA